MPLSAAEAVIDDDAVLLGDRDTGTALLDLTTGEVISRTARASMLGAGIVGTYDRPLLLTDPA